MSTIFNFGHCVKAVAVSPDGKLFAASLRPTRKTSVPLINVYNLSDSQDVFHQPFNPQLMMGVYSVAFSPDGKFLACALSDGGVHVYDTETWQVLGEKTSHRNSVHKVCFWQRLSGEVLLASGSSDAIVIRQVTDHLEPSLQSFEGPRYGLFSLAFHQTAGDNLLLAAGDGNGMFWLWDVESGQLVNKRSLEETGGIWSIVSLDSGRMLVATQAGNILLLTFDDKNSSDCIKVAQTGIGCIFAIAVSPDKSMLASAARKNITLHDLFSPAGAVLRELKGHWDDIWDLAFTPDGKNLISGSDDGTARIWDLEHSDPEDSGGSL